MPKARGGPPAMDLIPIVLILLSVARSTTGLYPTADIHGLGARASEVIEASFRTTYL